MSPYTVPKLESFTADALEAASRDLIAACEAETAAVTHDGYKIFRDRWLARKNGILTQINDLWLKASPKEAKRDVGATVNKIKTRVEELVDSVEQRMAAGSSAAKLATERVDISLPGIRHTIGAEHPVIRTMNEIVHVFKNLGYSIGEGPEIETDFYNFEALNFPVGHPARDTQDTIFLAGQENKKQRDRLLLRTHTSPVQIRTMENQRPPVRIVIPGKVDRKSVV